MGITLKICTSCFHFISTDTECVNARPTKKGQWKQLTIKLRMAASGYRLIQGGLPLSMWMRTQADAHRSEGNPWPSLVAFSGLQWAGEPVGKRLGGAWSWGICWAAPKSARTISVVPSLTSRLSAAPMPGGIIIIMKGISVVPTYCARWECSALYTNNTRTHVFTHSLQTEGQLISPLMSSYMQPQTEGQMIAPLMYLYMQHQTEGQMISPVISLYTVPKLKVWWSHLWCLHTCSPQTGVG